jgi:hypothetical protein
VLDIERWAVGSAWRHRGKQKEAAGLSATSRFSKRRFRGDAGGAGAWSVESIVRASTPFRGGSDGS